jgi:hypothetical protein
MAIARKQKCTNLDGSGV